MTTGDTERDTERDFADLPLLALYGSLMRSVGPRLRELGLEGRMQWLGPCRLRGSLLHLGDYPGLVAGSGMVHGELWRLLDAGVLKVLDAYEDCVPPPPAQPEYQRRRVQLVEPERDAWVYQYVRAPCKAPTVASGDWRQIGHRRRQGVE